METFGVWGETRFSLSSQSSIDLLVFYFFDCCSCLLFSSVLIPSSFVACSAIFASKLRLKPRRFWKPSGFGVKGILLYFHILFLQHSQYPFILKQFFSFLNPEGFKNLRGLFKELNIFTNRINILCFFEPIINIIGSTNH